MIVIFKGTKQILNKRVFHENTLFADNIGSWTLLTILTHYSCFYLSYKNISTHFSPCSTIFQYMVSHRLKGNIETSRFSFIMYIYFLQFFPSLHLHGTCNQSFRCSRGTPSTAYQLTSGQLHWRQSWSTRQFFLV